jgi:hypothetical protein
MVHDLFLAKSFTATLHTHYSPLYNEYLPVISNAPSVDIHPGQLQICVATQNGCIGIIQTTMLNSSNVVSMIFTAHCAF